MTFDDAVAAFTGAVREKARGSDYVRTQLEAHVRASEQERFGVYCMSIARKLLDRSMPDGSVHAAVVTLWEEMGGGDPVTPFPKRGAPTTRH